MQFNDLFSWCCLYTILSVIIILALTLLAAKFVRRLLESFVKSNIQIDPIHYAYIKRFLVGAIYFLGMILAIYTVPGLQNVAFSLLASSGVLALIIGFASQQAVSNLISGLFIAFFKPFSINDKIKVGSQVSGVVEDITLRHTIIRTTENKRIIVPNATINSEIIENSSWKQSSIRKLIPIYLSYDANLSSAIHIIKEVVFAGKERVEVEVVSMTPGGIHLQAAVWCANETEAFYLTSRALQQIKEEFDKNGIKFAQCCITNLN